jgi:dCTP deaminase
LKTRHTRNGIQATFGKIEAGYHGTLALGLFNGNAEAYEMKEGSLICQICFEQMERPAQKTYAERSGNFQNQKNRIKR